jgi:EAL domain-containing protein (putative c-di-GMP-specific phosphodiesterase class I)
LLQNVEQGIAILQALKSLGLQVSIDDFGTGFSSLSYLKRLPVDKLKIDQSFIRDLNTDAGDAAIVTSIITLAHNLNLTVVAEGVENAEQLGFLRANRCDEIQGYLISRPQPADALTDWIHQFNSQSDDKAA